MNKKLFFIAALLAPGLTYGADISAPLSGQVVSAGSTSAVPAPAAAAGFTTQVLNADFTSAAWANPANYVVSCGATQSVSNQPSTWHFYSGLAFGSALPCSRTSIMTDPVFGNQTLRFQYLVSDYQTTYDGWLSFPSNFGKTGLLPNELYTRIVWRSDAGTINQQGGSNVGHLAYWSTTMSYRTPKYWNDENFKESFANLQWKNSLWEWPEQLVVSNSLQTVDMTQYHTMESLVTSDENTNVYECTWLDGTFIDCIHQSFIHSQTYSEHNRAVILALGVYGQPPVSNMTAYIKSIEIYSCPNFATSTCPGTMVTTWPFGAAR